MKNRSQTYQEQVKMKIYDVDPPRVIHPMTKTLEYFHQCETLVEKDQKVMSTLSLMVKKILR